MFNIHQYSEQQRRYSIHLADVRREQLVSARRTRYKQLAVERQPARLQSFLSSSNTYVEDDHYAQWSSLNQYRDVADKRKFLGFKAFVHKPNYDIGKYYTERERKEISFNQSKLKDWCNVSLKHKEESKKLILRQHKKSMHFTHRTDKERINETTLSDKLEESYRNYSQSKSKIGQIICTRPLQIDECRSIDHYDEELENESSKQVSQVIPIKESKDSLNKSGSNHLRSIYLSRGQSTSYAQGSSIPNIQPKDQGKKYFKLAKTMQLFSKVQNPQRIQQVLKNTQFERRKDLKNIRNNVHSGNFIKEPVM